MIDQISWVLAEEREDVVERCAHVTRDYIPLVEIWLEFPNAQITSP